MNILLLLRVPDYFTLLNAAFGLCALLAAGQSQDQISAQLAVIFIIFAAIADGLDGFLARKLGSSPIGANLDSLADLVSFGVAPAFLALDAFDSPNLWPAGIFSYCSAGSCGWPDSIFTARATSSSRAYRYLLQESLSRAAYFWDRNF